MPAIPEGYRELEKGEIIEHADMLCPANAEEFKQFKDTSRSIGKIYKSQDCPLNQTTIVIRKSNLPIKISVFAINLTRSECFAISKAIKNHPIFCNYDGSYRIENSDYFSRNFYILHHSPVLGTGNIIGFTPENQNSAGYFRQCVTLDFNGIMTYLNTNKIVPIKYNSLIIRADINFNLVKLDSSRFAAI